MKRLGLSVGALATAASVALGAWVHHDPADGASKPYQATQHDDGSLTVGASAQGCTFKTVGISRAGVDIQETVSERADPTADGLEQSWTFSEAPAGHASVEVDVRVSDCAHAQTDERGDVFVAMDGSAVRYGRATWVDAAGTRVPVDTTFANGLLHIAIPANAIDASRFPAVLDPLISPEIAPDLPVAQPARGKGFMPRAAFDGVNYMAVWQDSRTGASAIYATRVDASGSVLDPTGIPISIELGARTSDNAPDIAFDGTNYLVTWSDARSGVSNVYGTRVSPAGLVLDSTNIAITSGGGDKFHPAVAFDGSNYLVTWNTSAKAIRAARVSPAGAVLDASGIDVSSAGYVPKVACDGTNCLVVWDHTVAPSTRELVAARVSKAGAVLDAGFVLPGASTHANVSPIWSASVPSVAFDGTRYLVVWAGNPFALPTDAGAFDGQLCGNFVTVNGVALPPISISSLPYPHAFPSVGFDGTNYHVNWGTESPSKVYTTRVSTQGQVLDGEVTLAAGPTSYAQTATACHTGSCIALWQTGTDYVFALTAARLSGAGAVLDSPGIELSSPANTEALTSAAWGSTNALVAWADFRNNTNYALRAARIAPNGTMLDPSGIGVAANGVFPLVAFDGTNYLVVFTEWISQTDTYTARFARVSQAGVLLDPQGVTVKADAIASSVAFDGTNYFVVWTNHQSQPTIVSGVRISPAGVILDSQPIVISAVSSLKYGPSVAFNGTNYLVAWPDERQGNMDVYAARVTPAGALLDPFGIQVAVAPNTQQNAIVASDGKDFLVTWEDSRNDPGAADIYASRVTAAGTVLDPNGVAISYDLLIQGRPTLIYNGTAGGYAVAWNQQAKGPSVWPQEIAGTRVTATDAGLSVEEAGVWMGSPDQIDGQRFGGMLGGAMLLAYYRFDRARPFGSTRARVRWVALGDAGVPDVDVPIGPTDAAADSNDAASGDGGLDASIVADSSPPVDANVVAETGADGANGTDAGGGSGGGDDDGGCSASGGATGSGSSSLVAMGLITAAAFARRRRRSRRPVG